VNEFDSDSAFCSDFTLEAFPVGAVSKHDVKCYAEVAGLHICAMHVSSGNIDGRDFLALTDDLTVLFLIAIILPNCT
jgi:hypothetical protein